MQRTIWKFPISGRDFEVSGLIEPFLQHGADRYDD